MTACGLFKSTQQNTTQWQKKKLRSSAPATGIQKPQILTASTIDELNKQIKDIKKNLTEGQTITCGAIARNRDNGTYSIRIDII